MSPRLSYSTRRRRNWFSPGNVRSVRPTTTCPGHAHPRCGAWPVTARGDVSRDGAEWRRRRRRDTPGARSAAAAAVAGVHRAAGRSHPPKSGVLVSRSGCAQVANTRGWRERCRRGESLAARRVCQSWLSSSGASRTTAILPWGAHDGLPKLFAPGRLGSLPSAPAATLPTQH